MTDTQKKTKMRLSLSFLILISILIPFLAMGQPGNPGGDPDAHAGATEFNIGRNPGTVVDGGPTTGQIPESWTNPDHARIQDDAYAFMNTSTKNKKTGYLLAQNFGFNIPAGSSIIGIVVDIDRYASSPAGFVTDSRISLIDATGEIGLVDKSNVVLPWSPIDLDNYQTYGGVTDTWGLSEWTSSKINNANFGVAIQAQTSNDNTTFGLFVDEIRITVFYLSGGASRYAVASGNWSSTSSWSLAPGGAPGASSPSGSNDVFIGGGHTITLDITQIGCNSLTIGTTEATPAGKLAFAANASDMTVHTGGFVITSDGDVMGTQAPIITSTGDFTLNAVLTNRNFVLRMGAEGTGRSVINGTGSLSNLVVPIFVVHTGNLTITNSLLGDSFRLINASSGHLTYSGQTNATATLLLDLAAPGNTVEFTQTLADASDFDFHKLSITFQNLVISGNAPKYYNGPIAVFGDLTITPTGILSNQSNTDLTLYGNWTNNNGLIGFVPGTCNGCTVIFKGGNSQISNSAGLQFNRIEVAKDSTLSVLNNIILDNQLLMTSGRFDLGTSTLTGTASTVFNGGELISATTGLTVPALTGSYTINGGAITFNGTAPQTIRSSTSTPPIASYNTVRFSGTGTKSLSGPVNVAANLTIDGGGTLDVTASNLGITLAGNWTNTGSTFLAQNGTVVLNGNSAQTISNPAGETFHSLTINNSISASAILLNDPITVNGLLTFTDGHIVATDTSLLSLGAFASMASTSDASHVVGPVSKVVNSTSFFSFPVGDGANYMPASITPTSSAATTFVAQYFSLEQSVGTTETGIDHVSAQDYWTIERTSGAAEAAVTLVWEYGSSADAEIDNLADLLVAQWDGSNWTSRGNVGTTGTFVAGSVTSTTVTSFSPPYFVIGSSTSNNPLSNRRYFAPLVGNWNDAGVWSYRPGGPTNAPEPSSSKFVIIPPGNIATILDSPSGQATKTMRSLTVLGTLTLGDAASQDVIVNVGNRGLTLGSAGNIVGTDNGDEIRMSGDITLSNVSNLSHTLLETNFATQNNIVGGTGGALPILKLSEDGQTFTGATSFTNLIVDSPAINNGSITITGSLSGNDILTNSASGTVVWQGASASGKVIDASAPGNNILLINGTGGDIDIDDFVATDAYGNLTLSGPNAFIQGSDIGIVGTLSVLSGGTFNISSNNNLTLAGHLTNDGTFNATSGTVTFNGTTSTSGASTSSFNNVVISGTLTPTATFNLRGDFTNNGSFVTGTGTVVFNGNTAQSISGTIVTTFNNISVTNASAPVQIQSDQNMAGILNMVPNSVFDADGTGDDKVFTLLSAADNPSADASIAALPAGASVTGQVTVQRYMSVEGNNSGRIYRYISSPVQNASVSQIQPFIPVTGTFAGSSSCSGCGTTQSMFFYDETVITDINGSGAANSNDGYLNFPSSTNSEVFAPGIGYTIFVRANVAPILGFDSVVWSLRGPINSGNISLPVTFTSSGTPANDGWNLVGNPYPSTIDWDAAGWTRTNLDNTTYMLDNGLGSPVYATHVAGGASANGGTQYIATGQAFFVKGSGGPPALLATESVKVAGTQTTFLRTAAIQDIVRITLRQGTRSDETVIQFKPGATAGFDSNSDAHKLDNPAPMYNLATVTSGTRYVINALAMPAGVTEVPMDITSASAGNYSLQFSEFESLTNPAMTIALRDNFLGTSTDLRSSPNYPFQVTSDAASFGNTRFTIIFEATVTTGLETAESSQVSFYPNPTKNIVNVEVRSNKEVNAKVISSIGTTLFEKSLDGVPVKKCTFNLTDYPDGIYIILIQDGTRQVQQRIVKQP
jgi:hypothetical protein